MGDEELEDFLGERVFGGEHSMVWVGEDSRLEDYGEVCVRKTKRRRGKRVREREKKRREGRETGKLTRCSHEILIALLLEDAEQIEDVEEEVFVGYG